MRMELAVFRKYGLRTARALRSPLVPFRHHNETYYMPGDEAVTFHLLNSVDKLWKLASFVPSDAKVVVDVGAHAGLFTAFARERAPDARFLSIEPDPAMNEVLRANGVEATFKAVTNQVGRSPFYRSPVSTQTSSLREEVVVGPSDHITVETTTIDEFCTGLDVDVLKVDVQGTERLVLEGARNTLPRVRTLLIEVSFLDPDPDWVLTFLRGEFGSPEVVNLVAGGADLAYHH